MHPRLMANQNYCNKLSTSKSKIPSRYSLRTCPKSVNSKNQRLWPRIERVNRFLVRLMQKQQ
ncbi:hypothetical protein B0H12DRAFT_1099960 [Mycena haematopus]|nr:hypothetical protein B0H12DRAFT_1137942 [Mycena haematopus]KAJ7240169.1 hypothetical protein B0H12DRAFT_1135293 [Mycena haematopus]KAJ7261285.1 hypothetical protein B0H12DRAFT_1106108 [Mycena haematopus]KAJ7265878.1 hypothetical protein B0H12DRAFT_1099960 [Mycena haematopus]